MSNTKTKPKAETEEIMISVITAHAHQDDLPFRGFQIANSDVNVAWEKMKSKHGLTKCKVKKPEIEAYVIIDEHYERIHDRHPDSTTSFLRIYGRKRFIKPEYATIVIRESHFKQEYDNLYTSLELECEKLLEICTNQILIMADGITPQEHMKEVGRHFSEKPNESLCYMLTGDGKMHKILAFPKNATKEAQIIKHRLIESS